MSNYVQPIRIVKIKTRMKAGQWLGKKQQQQELFEPDAP